MSTHNICFQGERRKIFSWYSPLSRAMKLDSSTYLWQQFEIAINPLSVTLHQLVSTCVRLWHLAAACNRILSPFKAPRLHRLIFNSWNIKVFIWAAPCRNVSSGVCRQWRPIRAVWSGPSLSANRIIGYYRQTSLNTTSHNQIIWNLSVFNGEPRSGLDGRMLCLRLSDIEMASFSEK